MKFYFPTRWLIWLIIIFSFLIFNLPYTIVRLWLSGWRLLVKRYRYRGPAVEPEKEMVMAFIGGIGFGAEMNVNWLDEGLYLRRAHSIWSFLFPPILIPWSAIQRSECPFEYFDALLVEVDDEEILIRLPLSTTENFIERLPGKIAVWEGEARNNVIPTLQRAAARIRGGSRENSS